MAKFIVRRLLSLLLTMLILSMVIFLITEAAPGDAAKHILGRFADREQVALFRRQLGLDEPLHIRYLTWLIGSDWRASRLIGMPLRRLKDQQTGAVEWWVEDSEGTLKRWKTVDDELQEYQLMRDGEVKRHPAGNVWKTDAHGNSVFWGVDTANRAVMWQRGFVEPAGGTHEVGRPQLERSGGVRYIPLYRGVLRGDPGISVQTNRPVADTLFRRVENSAILAGLAFVVVMPLGLLLGFTAGVNEGKWLDRILSVGGLLTTASPNFATAVFLILVFAIWLKWFPGATIFLSDRAIFDDPEMLVLPILTLTLIDFGYILRITRASVVEVMETAYIRTAILKGIPYWKVILKHAARNALLAPITVIMLHVNWLMGGVLVVEAMFGFPGLGTYLLNSALMKDIYAIEAGAMVMVVLAVGTQLVADIVYTFLNPRIRYG